MIFDTLPKQNSLRAAITEAYRMNETRALEALLPTARFSPEALQNITNTAKKLVEGTRLRRKKQGGLDAFLHQYDLSSDEGIALMCLAEALLRTPDTYTMDRLISDKIGTADWQEHLDRNNSLFVNAATWSLLLTGKIYSPTLENNKSLGSALRRKIASVGSAVIRPIILQGMKIIGKQYVMGRTIDEAIARAKKLEAIGYCYSYDMLGEAARTAHDADLYFKSYQTAITAIGHAAHGKNLSKAPGISIKLSALHPRYELAKRDRVMKELVPRLLMLAEQAKAANISLTVDAEEADRLDISLDCIEAVFSSPTLAGWEGFGLAVQSYQKRAPFVIDWLADLSKRHHRKLMVRLIKGAYWDAEIKQSQVLGLEGFPVFTRKNSTDVSFLACAKKLLASPECFYPMFGTHNAFSTAAIIELTRGKNIPFEFQCLHGMGQPLYDQIVRKNNYHISCRIYAPVGSHKDLLGYLVRRLLENGANTSFINLIADDNASVDKIIADPVARIAALNATPHPYIPLPENIFGSERKNSEGLDMSNLDTLTQLKLAMEKAATLSWESAPIINGQSVKTTTVKPVHSPIDNKVIGELYESDKADIENALTFAAKANATWGKVSLEKRAAILDKAADLLEENKPTLIAILCREAGKQINDCLSEVREAVDFCRYYAARARTDLVPKPLTGPTGEYNELSLHPRGTFICISPWNFPLAIFLGQVVAALAAGNTVLAKPSEQTTLIAAFAIKLLHHAGVPKDALHLITGRGSQIGAQCLPDERIAGVMFTGSTETAKIIQQTLAHREGPMVPFVAETGGQNAMIVDSSALPEQVVADTIYSAFNSAGQRCSALRVLFLQNDIADRVITMLKGAMAEIKVGDPGLLSTDVGPVIDKESLENLQKHFAAMQNEATLLYQVPTDHLPKGTYFAPCAFELKNLSQLPREVFGPILHIIRFDAKKLDDVLDQIHQTGYGLTLGIQSRIDATIEYIKSRAEVGNIYVNRNMIGAVVGVQPFGGERLSGTGPKAGGPHYLPRLCVERTLSVNTTAAGGNATLVSLSDE